MATAAVGNLASLLGTSENSTRLILSLLSGYPLAWLYRTFLFTQTATVKHLYFIATGMLQCYFNFGLNVYHSFVNIITMFAVLRFASGSKFSLLFAFIYNTLYLMIAYYIHLADDGTYSISWTMPHCVLTLRLTAIAFDLYDGRKKQISDDAKDSALTRCPTLLEFLGHSYFFGGFLVGPQYCMQRYLNFVNNKYSDPNTRGPPKSFIPAMERLLLGVVYIALFQLVYLFVNDEFLVSPAFLERRLLTKCAILLVWGKTCLNKYIGSWLLTEGAIIYTGLSHNGFDSKKVPLWDACTNVRIKELETGSTLQDIIHSFNCNTNLWMAKYIFKRLRFLGNKMLSQVITLLYLAVWHGIMSGYYMCFLLEFVFVLCERQIAEVVERIDVLHSIVTAPAMRPFVFLIKKIFSTFLLSYALVSFSLLIWSSWLTVYASMYYIGHILPLALILFCTALKSLFPRKSSQNGVHSGSKKKF